MTRRISSFWVLVLAGLFILAGAIAWFQAGAHGGSGAPDSESSSNEASGERDEAFASSRKTTENKSDASARAAAGTVADDPIPADVGETAILRGRLVVEETGAPPVNATVAVRTGDDLLDYAWMVARAGGMVNYKKLQRSGEIELIFMEAGGWRPMFHANARADGTFEIRVPKRAARFTFEVAADFASYVHPEWFFPSAETFKNGVTVILNEAGALEGHLTGDAGRPLRGGWVCVEPPRVWNPSKPWTVPVRMTQTDKNGKFTFRGMDPGRPTMSAQADGYAASGDADAEITAGKVTNIEWKLQPETPLEGTVVDSKGKGVDGVAVRLMMDRRSFFRLGFGIAKSDADGRIRWKHLIPGSYRAFIYYEKGRAADGPDTIQLPIPADAQPPKWTIENGHFLAGKVIDSEGKPAARVLLSAMAWNAKDSPPPDKAPSDKSRSGWQSGFTAADGAFRLAGLPAGPLQITATLEKVSSATKTNIAQDSENIEIQLPGATGIAGTVSNAATGSPITTFMITTVKKSQAAMWGSRGFWGWDQNAERPMQSESGAFEIGGLDADIYYVRGTADGFSETDITDITVKSGELTREINIKLIPGGTIDGRVVDAANGEPIAGAEVEAVDASDQDLGMRMPGDRTHADGKFEIKGRRAGRVRIVAYHDKYVETSSEIVELRPGERVEIPLLTLGRGGAVIGVAIGRDGLPLQNAQIQSYFSEPKPSATPPRHAWRNPTAGADGSFKLEGLQPGTWTINAMPRATDGDWQRAHNKSLKTSVAVIEGQTVVAVFAAPKTTGCTLRGKVTRGGKPVTNGNINIWRQSQPGEDESNGNVQLGSSLSAAGEYEIEHVPPGKAYLNIGFWGAVESGGYSISKTLEIPDAAEFRFDIEIPPGGEVSGRVTRRSDGAPVAAMRISAYSQDDNAGGSQANAVTDGDGKYTLVGVVGTVTVTVANENFGGGIADDAKLISKTQSVQVNDAAKVALDFVLDEGASVVIEVLDPDGKPIAQAWVNVNLAVQNASGGGGYGSTNDLGIVKITGLAPGRARAHVDVEGYPPADSEEFDAAIGGEPHIQLKLARGVETTVYLRGPDGEILKLEYVQLNRAGRGWAGSAFFDNPRQPKDGSLKFTATPGTYTAVLQVPGYQPISQEIVVGNDGGAVLNLKADKLVPLKK
ncbi:MAG: carboxypeptidase regulatory-like domain-containing protein [Planctomycetes bacterium]|nr:carboxypeptidase regulatory-like domain-containing protein [Planctomycetota bacterium]